MKNLVYSLIAVLISGCVSAPIVPENKASPAPAINGQWPEPYAALFLSSLAAQGAGLVASRPRDLEAWCPGYAPAKAPAFYGALFSALSKYESDWHASTVYLESFTDGHGNRVESLGLFQMSVGDCGISDRAKFFDPATNISCAVTKFSALVAQNGVLAGGSAASGWLGAARYWSQFRKPDRVLAMQAKTKEACK